MRDGFAALSEREKETLRLLLAGHDAKSIARAQGLSVHTVNERLRDARMKLAVSSSREAARFLGEGEGPAPNSLGDKQFGVAADAADMRKQPDQRQSAAGRLVWLAGGMLIMSLVIAAAVLSSAFHSSGAADGLPSQLPPTRRPLVRRANGRRCWTTPAGRRAGARPRPCSGRRCRWRSGLRRFSPYGRHSDPCPRVPSRVPPKQARLPARRPANMKSFCSTRTSPAKAAPSNRSRSFAKLPSGKWWDILSVRSAWIVLGETTGPFAVLRTCLLSREKISAQ